MKPKLSVIIPTHNRADTLEKTLRHLEAQTIASEIEAIVINDIPNDKAFERVANSAWQIPIHFETIKPCHQGVARNHGVQKARASTVLFIGDDIFLKSDACHLHEGIHNSGSTPVTVLGSTMWDPEMEVTPVMEWLMLSGWQFGYPKIDAYAGNLLPEKIQHQFTYTSHISVPTEIAVRTPFLEDVTLYGWEDMEWGMRLRKNGVRVYYEPRARGYHHHRLTMEDSLQRMETIGESAVLLSKTISNFDRVPRGWKRLAYEVFARFPTMAGKHRAAFLRGMRKAGK